MAEVKVIVIGEDKASATLANVDKSLGGFANSFTELQAKIGLAQQAIGIFTGTFQKAFEIGAEGGAVLQTAASFDILLQKIGAAPDLLNQLRDAANGTIPDMQLMASTSTLLAGTQGTLATELANATPQLLEIAKAANKLNPSLGDTTFQYNSLALGIKRASPMILDNLGLTIKLEQAYQTYADSVGKTTAELTAEEQKLALLNATLEAGNVLIQQAGGTTDSTTDAFARFETATTNLTDALKAKLAPALATAAEAATLLLTWDQQLDAAFQAHVQTVRETSTSYAQYSAELKRVAEVAGYMVDAEGNLIQVRKDGGRVYKDVVQEGYLLTEQNWSLNKSALAAAEAAAGQVDWIGRQAGANKAAAAAVMEQAAAEEAETAKKEENQKVTVEVAKVMEKLSRETIAAVIEQFGKLTELVGKSTQSFIAATAEVLKYDQTLANLGVTLGDLQTRFGGSVSMTAGAAISGAGATGAPASPIGGGLTFVYAPTFSMADQYELQQKLTPIINAVVGVR